MWIFPAAEKTITAHYGELSEFRRSRGMQPHSGLDFGLKAGTRLPAVADGEISLIAFSKVLGWVLELKCKDNKGKTVYPAYSHLFCSQHGAQCAGGHASPFADAKKVGDKVAVGQIVARSGNSGNASSAAHLHFTISYKHKGVFGVTADKLDPYKFLQAHAKGEAPKQANPKAKAVVLPKVKKCASCGQETK